MRRKFLPGFTGYSGQPGDVFTPDGKMRNPTDQDFDTAIMWLQGNEGEGAERDSCIAVANWLAVKQADIALREEAKKAGVPVSRVRERLKSLQNPQK